MKRNHGYIVLTYGLFLGWLLSFPYNGPVLKHLVSIYDLPVAPYSLIYTATPVIFLVIYSFINIQEAYAKIMMTWNIIVCLTGTLLLFSVHPSFWYPILAVMGVCSVLFIIGWSYFYTTEIPIDQKLKIMALVIITGNITYYIINISINIVPDILLFILMLALLGGSFFISLKMDDLAKNNIPLEQESFPTNLILVMCLFLFAIKLNHGITFHAIQPSFDQLFKSYFIYYGMIPYIIVLGIMYLLGNKISGMLPVLLGTSLLGLAYLSFGLIGVNWYYYFVTETLLQAGRALLDLFLWTLFGIIASIYGRPLKICGLAFLANLFGVFAGGVLGVLIFSQIENSYFISAAYAIAIIFVSLLVIPWLNDAVENDLRKKLFHLNSYQEPREGSKPQTLSINLPVNELLTPREKEIAQLLIQGYTNKQIADMLCISENTMKTHARKIYRKLNVSNKRELLQLSFNPNSFQ